MRLPEEITNSSFYFYKGYIIRLYGDGGYSLYQLHVGGGTGRRDKQNQLKYCMELVDKLNQERDEEEKQEKEMAKFLKQLKPHVNAITGAIARELHNKGE